MEIGDRLRLIRKTLQLTQAEFGKKMGLKSTIIGQMEGNQRNITDRTLILLQEKYNINISYLEKGIGDMFSKPLTFSLDEYAKINSLSNKERILLRELMALDVNTRNNLYNAFRKAFTETDDSLEVQDRKHVFDDVPTTSAALEELCPPVAEKDTSAG